MSSTKVTAIAGLVFLGLAVGCGRPQESRAAEPGPARLRITDRAVTLSAQRGMNGVMLANAGSSEDVESIKTFSQSLQTVDFQILPPDRSAILTYKYYDFDRLDEKGRPSVTMVLGLRGKVAANGTATLTDPKVPDQIAKVQCADPSCNSIKIDIQKSSGKLAGTATVNIHTHRGVNLAFMNGDRSSTTEQTKIRDELSTAQPKSTDLTLIEIDQGRVNFFKIIVNFDKKQLPGSTEPPFDFKRISAAGPIGRNVMVSLGIEIKRSGATKGAGASHSADVEFNRKLNLVTIKFLKDRGLTWLSAGVFLFESKP
jgi:hypothetical protein